MPTGGPTSPTYQARRGSTNEDLVAWHGMSVKNFTTMVAGGLPNSVRRRTIWMDIISTELKTRSKTKMSQGFIAFVAATSTSSPSLVMPAPALSMDASAAEVNSRDARRLRSQRSSTLLNEKHMNELINELKDSKFVFVDDALIPFIQLMSHILVPELQLRSDLLKILTFILHREQLPHNDRCILPYGDTTAICLDTFEAVLQSLCGNICAKFTEWKASRVDILMNLLLLPFSTTFAGALRLRIMDHILVNGCVGIASIVIAYFHRRREDILNCTSALAFAQLCQENSTSWLLPAQTDDFWKECSDVHRSHFLYLYAQRAIQMRAKHMTFNLDNYSDKFLVQQREELCFDFKNYDWIGFTVDHTLAEFKLEFLLQTSLNKAFAKVQAAYINLKTSAPPRWQPFLAHRGLAVDIVRGNFILFGSRDEVLSGYHGTEEIPLHQINWQYPQAHRQDTQWIYIYTIPEMIYPQLFAWLVDQYERGALTNDEIGYVKTSDEIYHDMAFILPKSAYAVLSTIALEASTAYYESDFLPTLLSTPEVLLHYNPNARKTLETLVYTAKKKLFLLTNSSWEHTNAAMQYSIGKDWVSFFDCIVTQCMPNVFHEETNTRQFMEVQTLHGSRSLVPMTTSALECGKVYAGGSKNELMKTLGKDSKVCFVGNHLLYDIIFPSQTATNPWDTVAIIHEINIIFRYLEKGHLKEQVQSFVWSFFFPTTVETRCRPASAFFYSDVGGVYTFWGKKVNQACVLCVDSITRLANHNMSVDALVHNRLDRRRDSHRASTRASATTTYDKFTNMMRPHKITAVQSVNMRMSLMTQQASDRRLNVVGT